MINEIINTYVKENISPKDFEKKDVSNKYEDISKMLKGFNFQSGSFARFTSITPINDLDVIWELPEDILSKKFDPSQVGGKTIDPSDLDISDILEGLANKLKDEYGRIGVNVMKIVAREHSVSIFFGPTEDDFSIDVVPAIPSGLNEYGQSIYWVPEIAKISHSRRKNMYLNKEKIEWIKSDPRGYIKEAADLNNHNNNYRHVVKFCKKWKWVVKQVYPEIKFKSFHIEMLIKELFNRNLEINTLNGLLLFFSEIKNYLSEPKIKDRANNGKFIDDYVFAQSEESKNKLINEGFKVVNILNNLSSEADGDVIKTEISQIFSISKVGNAPVSKSFFPISKPYSSSV